MLVGLSEHAWVTLAQWPVLQATADWNADSRKEVQVLWRVTEYLVIFPKWIPNEGKIKSLVRKSGPEQSLKGQILSGMQWMWHHLQDGDMVATCKQVGCREKQCRLHSALSGRAQCLSKATANTADPKGESSITRFHGMFPSSHLKGYMTVT